MNAVEAEGTTIEEAIANTLRQLDVERELVEIEVLAQPTKGFLGIGGKKARVRATLRVPLFVRAPEPPPPAVEPRRPTQPQRSVEPQRLVEPRRPPRTTRRTRGRNTSGDHPSALSRNGRESLRCPKRDPAPNEHGSEHHSGYT
jgi:hypothetical protein